MRSKVVSEILMAVRPMSTFGKTRANDPVAIKDRKIGIESAASIHPVVKMPSAYKRPVDAPVSRAKPKRNRKFKLPPLRLASRALDT
jgi:hypothetical protein